MVAITKLRDDRGVKGPVLTTDLIAVRADVFPHEHLFGDSLTAQVDVLLDRAFVKPESVQVEQNFAPFRVQGAVRREREDLGDTTHLKFVYRLDCLRGEPCLPNEEGRTYELPEVRVSYVVTEIGDRTTTRVAIAPLTGGSRLLGVNLDAPAFRADPRAVPEPTYRVSPTVLAAGALGLAGLLVLAALVLIVPLVPLGFVQRWRACPACAAAHRPGARARTPARDGARGRERRGQAGARAPGERARPRRERRPRRRDPPARVVGAAAGRGRDRRALGRRRPRGLGGPQVMAVNPRAIPLADLRELRVPLLRTAVVRVVLALLLLGLLAGAWAIVRDDDPGAGASLIPGGEGGVIVLDLSASIGSTPHQRTANALRYVQETRQSFGMVLFSDVAYEAVPPGTASTEMRPFMRHFGRVRLYPCIRRGSRPCPVGTYQVPEDTPWEEYNRLVEAATRGGSRVNPWASSFRSGTRISRGLETARETLRREGMAGLGVLLISDLDDSLFDVPQLTQTLIRFKREEIPLKIVGLRPATEDRELFRRAARRRRVRDPPRAAAQARRARSGAPQWVGHGLSPRARRRRRVDPAAARPQRAPLRPAHLAAARARGGSRREAAPRWSARGSSSAWPHWPPPRRSPCSRATCWPRSRR